MNFNKLEIVPQFSKRTLNSQTIFHHQPNCLDPFTAMDAKEESELEKGVVQEDL